MARAAYGLPGGSLHSGRWIALTAAMAVLVMAAAAATLTLANGRARSGSPQAGAPARRFGLSAGPSPTASGGTSATAPANGNVVVAAGAAATPHERPVVSFLTRYFAAINHHDYQAYLRLFSAAIRGSLTAAAFSAGYGSTRDSLATLRHIGIVRPGQLAAVITFTSHQKPGQSPSQSACTRWRISLYLTREGNEYQLQRPPSGYQASFLPGLPVASVRASARLPCAMASQAARRRAAGSRRAARVCRPRRTQLCASSPRAR